MTKRQKKFAFIVAGVTGVGIAVGLVLYALKDNVNLYFTPTQVFNKQVPAGRSFRIGGMVVDHSIKRDSDGLTVHFEVTDSAKNIPVVYKGILPDLFKEAEMTVVQGKLGADGILYADEVFAKHNEKYVPPEAKDAMEQAQAQNKAAPTVKAAPSPASK